MLEEFFLENHLGLTFMMKGCLKVSAFIFLEIFRILNSLQNHKYYEIFRHTGLVKNSAS